MDDQDYEKYDTQGISAGAFSWVFFAMLLLVVGFIVILT